MITYKQLSLADTFENCQAVDSSKADMTIFDTSQNNQAAKGICKS